MTKITAVFNCAKQRQSVGAGEVGMSILPTHRNGNYHKCAARRNVQNQMGKKNMRKMGRRRELHAAIESTKVKVQKSINIKRANKAETARTNGGLQKETHRFRQPQGGRPLPDSLDAIAAQTTDHSPDPYHNHNQINMSIYCIHIYM